MRWPWSQTRYEQEPTGRGGPSRRVDSTAIGPAGTANLRPKARTQPPDPSREQDPRPVWLLDVDGVLNANRPGWGTRPAEGYAHAGDGQFWIRWSPGLVDRLMALDRTGAVEVRWATTWVPWIGAIEELLGLPAWKPAWEGPYEGAGTPAIPTPLRKVQTALQVVEGERRPLIWTDDDAIPVHGPMHDRIVGAGVPCLLVRPASRAGLQPEDLDTIEAFLQPYLSRGEEPAT